MPYRVVAYRWVTRSPRRWARRFDIFLVRKLGVPGQEELAMGAIASGGIRVLNEPIVQMLGLTEGQIERVEQEERHELERREHDYRAGRPPLDVTDKIAILVDDGLATGCDHARGFWRSSAKSRTDCCGRASWGRRGM